MSCPNPSRKLDPATLGHTFEKRVMYAMQKNNYVKLGRNQWNKNYAPEKDSASKREYDLVMFGLTDKQVYIVECKAHYTRERKVHWKQVEEFRHKLRNYNGMYAKRMMVTDTGYTTSARQHAEKHNIILVDGRQLRQMENNKHSLTKTIVSNMMSTGLESLVKGLAKHYVK